VRRHRRRRPAQGRAAAGAGGAQGEAFRTLWKQLRTHLAPGGLLALQLFGDRDEWADGGHETEATYHSRAEVDVLTEGLERVFFDEVERDGHTALGDAKHWHIFHMILRRPG
jgi:tellurite methyltransferase